MGKAFRLTPNASAVAAAKKTEREKAKSAMPAMDAYLLINNPNSTQQRDQITLLTNAALGTVRGGIGG